MVPDEIDVNFLRSFRTLIEDGVKKGASFLIITGGGKICRKYQVAAEGLGISSGENLDWVGIHVTRLNAHCLRILLGELSSEEIITDPRFIGNENQLFGGVEARWKLWDFGANRHSVEKEEALQFHLKRECLHVLVQKHLFGLLEHL